MNFYPKLDNTLGSRLHTDDQLRTLPWCTTPTQSGSHLTTSSANWADCSHLLHSVNPNNWTSINETLQTLCD